MTTSPTLNLLGDLVVEQLQLVLVRAIEVNLAGYTPHDEATEQVLLFVVHQPLEVGLGDAYLERFALLHLVGLLPQQGEDLLVLVMHLAALQAVQGGLRGLRPLVLCALHAGQRWGGQASTRTVLTVVRGKNDPMLMLLVRLLPSSRRRSSDLSPARRERIRRKDVCAGRNVKKKHTNASQKEDE